MSRWSLPAWVLALSVLFSGVLQAQDYSAMWNAAKRWKLGLEGPLSDQVVRTDATVTNADSPPNTPDIAVFAPSANAQSENSIGFNPANPNQIMVSTNGRIPGSNPVVHQPWAFSTDGGVTWPVSLQSEDIPPGIIDCFGDPVAMFDVSGRAYYVTLGSPGGIYVVSTTNLGGTWSARSNADPSNSTGDDKEHASTDHSGVFPNNVYAAWTDFNATGSPVIFTRSTNQGATWGPRVPLQIGSNRGQGVHISTGPNGEVYVKWAHYTTGTAEVGIGFARSTDGGVTFSTPTIAYPISGIRISNGGIPALNNVRAASFPYFDVDRSTGSRRGWIYSVTPELVSGQADIFLRRSTDGGTTWSSAIQVNGPDVAVGKWQFMASLAVDQTNGNITVSYYSMDSVGTNFQTNRYAAYSVDGGNTWDRWVISDVRANWQPQGTPNTNANYNGDYYETAAYGGKAWATWTDRRTGGNKAYVERIIYSENFGWVRGTVTNVSGGSPLSGVAIDFVQTVQQIGGSTDPTGFYLVGARVDTPGTTANLTLRARKFGFRDTTLAVTVTRFDTLTRNFGMTPSPSGTLFVRSIGADSTIIRSNVRVLFGTTEVVNAFTDSITGNYSTTLPAGTYDVIVDPPSPYGTRRFNAVVITASQTTPVYAVLRRVVQPNPVAMRDTLAVGQTRGKTLMLTNTTTDSVPWRLSTDEAVLKPLTLEEKEQVARSTQQQDATQLPKGAPDARTEPVSLRGRGGPDAFGYVWIDSDEPGGPTFGWIDIRPVATRLVLTDDQNTGPFPLGFNFSFYGTNYNSIRVCSNGWVSFTSTSTAYDNTAIPTTAQPNDALYPFWDDLNPAATGRRDTVYYYADAANQRFIVQYQNVRRFSDPTVSEMTFQVILNANGTMLYQYLRMVGVTNSATIGIENLPGTIALQTVFNAAYMHDSLAILFKLRGVDWLSYAPDFGVLAPMASQNVTGTFDATGLTAGTTYNATTFLDVTHPDVTGSILIPTSLRVQPATGPLIILSRTSITFPTTPVNATRRDSLTVRNGGDQTLNLTSLSTTNPRFVVSPTSGSVLQGDSLRVYVNYTPTAAGTDTGRVRIVSNSGGTPVIDVLLDGTAIGVPNFAARVDSLVRSVSGGSRDSIQFYVRNTGTASGNFSARAVMYPRNDPNGAPVIVPMEITPATPAQTYSDEYLRAIVGRAPVSDAPAGESRTKEHSSPVVDLGDVIGERAFGYEYFGANFVKFNLSTPGTLVQLGGFSTGDNIFAGDFTNDGNTLYAIKGLTNELIRVDTNNGSYTVVGPVTIQSGHTWTSMKFDPNGTLYATSTGASISTLYTINPNNGNTTVVGTITNIPIIIGMAIHPSTGQMYGYDIESGGTQPSRFFSINKSTGAGTLIGSTGFIGRFAQDMDFDPVTGILYMAAYNFGISPATAELRTVNLTTGLTTLLGVIGVPQREVDFFAIKGSVSTTAPWLSVLPTSGTIAVSDSILMKAYFDARDPSIYNNPGNYYGRIEITATNSTLADSLNIPARMFVVPPAGARLTVSRDSVDFGNVEIGTTDSSQFVTVRNIGAQTLNVTGINMSNTAFAVSPTSFSLASLDTIRLRLRFTAVAPGGVRTGTMTFVSNDPAAPTVGLRARSLGVSHIATNPTSFTFSRGTGSDTTRATMRVRNTGTDTLRYVIDEALGTSLASILRSMEQQPVPELGKNDRIHLPGEPVTDGQGGPDAFGYRWIDSDEPGGPTFNWIDIRPVATPLILFDDQNSGPFQLGFTFNFYGNNYNSVRICSNGFLSFTSTATTFTNTAIPTTAAPNDALYPFWDDLNPAAAGRQDTVFYYADAANNRFIVQYQNVRRYADPTTSEMTFQVIINANGTMVYQYLQMVGVTNDATIGIENLPGTIALQVVYNAPYMHDNLAILITKDIVPWMSVEPTEGVIAPGDSQSVEVRVHPAGLAAGNYNARFRVTGNTPDTVFVPVTLTLTVGVDGELALIPTEYSLTQNYPNPFNPATTIRFGLPEQSHVRLRVYNTLGQEVVTLADAEHVAGYHDVRWEGRNGAGGAVASGVYFIRLETTGISGQTFTSLKKMLLMK